MATCRIGVLHHGSASSPMLARLGEALSAHGLKDGVSCHVEACGANGALHRLPRLAHELIARCPDIIAVIGGLAALAAQDATTSIPVLHATVLEPADIGLQRPNLAGVTTFDPQYPLRQLQLMGAMVPGLAKIACLTDPGAPVGADGVNPLESALRAAASIQDLIVHQVALDSHSNSVESAFASIQRAGVDAVIALEVPAVVAALDDIAETALRYRLPTIGPDGRPVRMAASLGPSLMDAMEPLAGYVAAIVDGRHPSELPTHRVRGGRWTINRSVVLRLGLEVPRTSMVSACAGPG